MSNIITPKNALISVFHKEGLAPIINKLNDMGINIYSTGGTEKFIAANNNPRIRKKARVSLESIKVVESISNRKKDFHEYKTITVAVFAGLSVSIATHSIKLK